MSRKDFRFSEGNADTHAGRILGRLRTFPLASSSPIEENVSFRSTKGYFPCWDLFAERKATNGLLAKIQLGTPRMSR